MPVRAGTVTEVFLGGVTRQKSDHLFVPDAGVYHGISSAELLRRVVRSHWGLRSLGLRRGDRCALLSENRWEWCIADFALLTAGIVSVPLDSGISPGQLASALIASGCRSILVSTTAQRDKVLAIRNRLPLLDSILVLEGGSAGPTSRLFSFAQWASDGLVTEREKRDFEASARHLRPEDRASILVDFAEQGAPAAREVTHREWINRIARVEAPVRPDDTVLFLLPLQRPDERALLYSLFARGASIAVADPGVTLPPVLRQVKPTVLAAASPAMDSLEAGIARELTAAPGGVLRRRALRAGSEAARYKFSGRPVPIGLRLRVLLFNRWILVPLRSRIGGRLRLRVCGGGPVSSQAGGLLGALGAAAFELPVRTISAPEVPKEAPGTVAPVEGAGSPAKPQPALSREAGALWNHLSAATRGSISALALRGAPRRQPSTETLDVARSETFSPREERFLFRIRGVLAHSLAGTRRSAAQVRGGAIQALAAATLPCRKPLLLATRFWQGLRARFHAIPARARRVPVAHHPGGDSKLLASSPETPDEAPAPLAPGIPADQVREDVWRPLSDYGPAYVVAVILTALLALIGVLCWDYQSESGLGVTGLQAPVTWCLYSLAFAFWFGLATTGAALSAILRLTEMRWRTPVTRAAEFMAVFALVIAAWFLFINIGRPAAVLRLLAPWNPEALRPNLGSPWFLAMTAVFLSLIVLLFYTYLTLIADAAELRSHSLGWQQTLYRVLALRWTGSDKQWRALQRAVRLGAGLALAMVGAAGASVIWTLAPLPAGASDWQAALAGLHLFATGASSGVAALILILFVIRKSLQLESYLKPLHFEKLRNILAMLSLSWFLFGTGSYLLAASASSVSGLAGRDFGILGVVAGSLAAPLVPGAVRRFRTVGFTAAASCFVLAGACLDYVQTTLVPIRYPGIRAAWNGYSPAGIEIWVIAASFAGFVLMFLIATKLFPMLAVWEYTAGGRPQPRLDSERASPKLVTSAKD
jgi:Ni/Fe-hydrogenase subunit HybB-like protein